MAIFPIIEPDWFHLAYGLLGLLLGWLAKRLIRTLDRFDERLAKVENEVSYITGADRKTRLRDYGCPINQKRCPLDDESDIDGGLS